MNRYAYAANDPVNKSDPGGNYFEGDEGFSLDMSGGVLSSDFSSMMKSSEDWSGSFPTSGRSVFGGSIGGHDASTRLAGSFCPNYTTCGTVVGGALGAAAGVATAGACDAASGGVCAPANPGIVSAMSAGGAATGAGIGAAIDAKVHGNSYKSPRATEVYYLMENDPTKIAATGPIAKIGITSQDSRYSQPYLEAEGVRYVPQTQYSSRYPAVVDENIRLFHHYINNDFNLPRLNKTSR
jgi:hypothetical protein